MFAQISEISIIVTAILAAAVGSIWYSPLLFGSAWMKSTGLSPEDLQMQKKEMLISVIKGICAHTVFFFILAQFVIIGRANSISLYSIGFFLVLLIATYMYSSVLWEKRTWTNFLINSGYLAFIIFGGLFIIAYWPW